LRFLLFVDVVEIRTVCKNPDSGGVKRRIEFWAIFSHCCNWLISRLKKRQAGSTTKMVDVA